MSAAGRIVAAWERFFYTKGSTAALGVFRILFAYCLFDEVNTTRAKSQFAIEGGFHLPYVPFIQPVPEQWYGWIHDLQYPLIVLLGLGAFTRASCGALLFLQGWIFFADSFNLSPVTSTRKRLAPCSANSLAVARPIPEAAPVM